jgi:hypothetical protein
MKPQSPNKKNIHVKLEPWVENEAMISKWKKPSTWVRDEKEKKNEGEVFPII